MWRAFGWSVVQLEQDEALEPMHGMYVTLAEILTDEETRKRTLVERQELRRTCRQILACSGLRGQGFDE